MGELGPAHRTANLAQKMGIGKPSDVNLPVRPCRGFLAQELAKEAVQQADADGLPFAPPPIAPTVIFSNS